MSQLTSPQSPHPGITAEQAGIGLGLISLLILPAILLYPFNVDNNLYQAMGVVLIRYHGLPYISSWDMNFPGIVALHAIAIGLFGNSILGFRTFELLAQIITAYALYRVSRLWLCKESSLLACLLYAIFYINGPTGIMGQRDSFVVLPLILAMGFMTAGYRSATSNRRMLLAFAGGSLYAFATFIRPTYGLLLIVPALTLFPVWQASGRKMFAFTLLGFILAFLLAFSPYVFVHRGIEEVFLATVRFNFDVYTPQAAHLDIFARRTQGAVALALGWMALMLLRKRRGAMFRESPHSGEERKFLIASAAAILLGIIAMRKLSSYHFTPFYALFMPVLSAMLWEWKSKWGRHGTFILGTSIAILAVMLYPRELMSSFIHNHYSFSQHYRMANPDSLHGVRTSELVADYLLRNTGANDTVEISSPGVQWRLDRPQATRYIALTPLTLSRIDGSFTSYQKTWQSEYVARIAKVRPKFYVAEDTLDRNGRISTPGLLPAIPGLMQLLDRDYYLDTTIGIYVLYHRR
jgi:hypothetical protein